MALFLMPPLSASYDRGVTSPQEAMDVSLIKVTPLLGKGTLGTWWCHGQRGAWSRRRRWDEVVSKPMCVGAYANQRLTLVAVGKIHHRKAKTSNRTWEIRPSGMIGGFAKRGQGGIVNPPHNRKDECGNPPPTAGASEFYPNHNPPLGPTGGNECNRLFY